MDSAGERFEAIRAALADRNNILTVKDLCELAGVSRSGYYNWVRSEKNRELREAKDRAAFEQILEAYRFRGYAKGVRGIHMRLLHMGIRMNVKKIRRLMRKYKLTCPIRKPNPYRGLQRSIRMGSAAENLVNREFESHGPRAILLTDITYIPLRGRFCYHLALAAKSYGRCVEAIKFYLALKHAGLPVIIYGAEFIKKRLLGLERVGIVPNEVMPFYCHSRFPGEDVDSFRHLNHENPDAEIALIEWQPIKPVKLKENAHE